MEAKKVKAWLSDAQAELEDAIAEVERLRESLHAAEAELWSTTEQLDGLTAAVSWRAREKVLLARVRSAEDEAHSAGQENVELAELHREGGCHAELGFFRHRQSSMSGRATLHRARSGRRRRALGRIRAGQSSGGAVELRWRLSYRAAPDPRCRHHLERALPPSSVRRTGRGRAAATVFPPPILRQAPRMPLTRHRIRR
ncbi:uncharacterized protein LOC127753300 [Oryza glaberrima]|uniref:uncharacterized protein LOC127753300 n=1 Tax=Oryza glaberrima TaxID=4538 RepID=UPI00023DC9D8|nr:uncharacterized protein LOC127753300 [Oryza glaberrima]